MRRLAFIPILITLTFGSLLGAAEMPKKIQGTVQEKNLKNQTLMIAPTSGGDVVVAKAGSGDLAIYDEGDVVRGMLSTSGGDIYIDHIFPAGKDALEIMRSVNQRLRNDTSTRGQAVFREIGEQLPDFALWDQHGDLVQADQLEGKVLVINFIFTRCTNATMCPAATDRMARLQDKVREAGYDDVRFVSITLDPEYDTPGVFNAYADAYNIEDDTFYFLGGDTKAVNDLQMQLGVLAQPDQRFIMNHTMRTLIVDRDGEIFYQVPGAGWDIDDFMNRIKKLEERKS